MSSILKGDPAADQPADHRQHHPFPFLKNKEIYIGVHLATKGTFVKLGIVPASGYFDRIIYLPGDQLKFILVEDLIWLFADKIFNNSRIIDKTIFRITRNADINPDEALYDEEIDFRDAMKDMIKRRRKLARCGSSCSARSTSTSCTICAACSSCGRSRRLSQARRWICRLRLRSRRSCAA
ncbi:MAG: hypothetical protein ACLSAP_06930 [Oscillospiraceae bacterium]